MVAEFVFFCLFVLKRFSCWVLDVVVCDVDNAIVFDRKKWIFALRS